MIRFLYCVFTIKITVSELCPLRLESPNLQRCNFDGLLLNLILYIAIDVYFFSVHRCPMCSILYIVMRLFSVALESRSLLESLGATVDIANIRFFTRVEIHMLGKINFLREFFMANLTLEVLDLEMGRIHMSFQTLIKIINF